MTYFFHVFSGIKPSQASASSIVLQSTDFITTLAMEFKMICLLVLGISSFSGAEAQDCVAWGESCLVDHSCCGGSTCTGEYSYGSFCLVDDSCIAGGYLFADAENMYGECCQGYVSHPVWVSSTGTQFYCVTDKDDNTCSPAGTQCTTSGVTAVPGVTCCSGTCPATPVSNGPSYCT